MSNLPLSRIRRVLIAVVCLAVAAAIAWRGNTYVDTSGFSMMIPVMCVLSAVVFALTAVGIFVGTDENAAWQD